MARWPGPPSRSLGTSKPLEVGWVLRGDRGCWGRSSRHSPQGAPPGCLQMLPYRERLATQLLSASEWGWGDAIFRGREASLPFPLGEWFPKWTPSWFRWVPLRVPRGCASSIPTSSPPEGQHPTFLPHFGDKIKGAQVGEFGGDSWQLLGVFNIIERSYSILSNMFIMPPPPLQNMVERRRD